MGQGVQVEGGAGGDHDDGVRASDGGRAADGVRASDGGRTAVGWNAGEDRADGRRRHTRPAPVTSQVPSNSCYGDVIRWLFLYTYGKASYQPNFQSEADLPSDEESYELGVRGRRMANDRPPLADVSNGQEVRGVGAIN